jgi:anti-anti-sigma factor
MNQERIMATEQKKPSKLSIAKVGNHMVLSLKESLTWERCDSLEMTVSDLIDQNKPWIILDFKSVPFIDSRALEILLRINVTLKQRGSLLKIIGLGSVCRDILTATRLINVFHVYEDMHKAIRAKT